MGVTVDQAFRLSAIFMAASSFLGLILTREVPIGLATLGWAALAYSLAHSAGWLGGALRKGLSTIVGNVLAIAAFGGFLVDLLWISEDLLPASVHFLVLLMVYKLVQLESRKDMLHLAGMSLLALLSAAAMTGEIWFAGVLTAFLLASTWTLLLAHLHAETDSAASPARADGAVITTAAPLLTSRMFWLTNGIALGALALTITIFLLIPRVTAGLFQKSRGEIVRTTGFSERVDLGMMGVVKMDQTVVMRVEFPAGRPSTDRQLYLRGLAYDLYSGRAWSNTFTRRKPLVRNGEDRFIVPDRSPTADVIRQDILLEPIDTPVLFGMPAIRAIDGRFQLLQVDAMDAVYAPFAPAQRVQYTAFSGRDGSEAMNKRATLPHVAQARYLQVPDSISRVRALAHEVAGGRVEAFERAGAIERHLREQYRYSLDIGPASGEPVEDFLFQRKTGYCEHYATAMVLMLRTVGIPARLVTGFLAGEWNDFGGYYTVRQRDAHAWVEAYVNDRWITFDPTPAAGVAPGAESGSSVVRFLDSVRMKWDRFIIQYSIHDQLAVAHGLHQRGEMVRSRLSDFLASALRTAQHAKDWMVSLLRNAEWVLAVGVIGIAATAVAGVLIWRRVRRIRLRVRGGQVAGRLYGRMLRILARRGFTRLPGTTPAEFAERVSRDWAQAASPVNHLTHLFCRTRYGQEPMSPLMLRQAESWLTELQGLKS